MFYTFIIAVVVADVSLFIEPRLLAMHLTFSFFSLPYRFTLARGISLITLQQQKQSRSSEIQLGRCFISINKAEQAIRMCENASDSGYQFPLLFVSKLDEKMFLGGILLISGNGNISLVVAQTTAGSELKVAKFCCSGFCESTELNSNRKLPTILAGKRKI